MMKIMIEIGNKEGLMAIAHREGLYPADLVKKIVDDYVKKHIVKDDKHK